MSIVIFAAFLQALEEEYGYITQEKLARKLEVNQATISNWKNGKNTPSKKNLEMLINAFKEHHAQTLIRPIFEFKEILPYRNGSSWVFSHETEALNIIKSELTKKIGIYLFYDSAGKAIYLGKSDVCLFNEAKQRLNALANRPFYNPNKNAHPFMGDMAKFLSAYEVTVQAAIKNIESFMLRSFANDLMNKNSGNIKNKII